MNHRRRQGLKLRPRVESVESRELMSGIIAVLSASPRVHPAAQMLTPGVPGTPTQPFVPGAGTPTAHELAREHFRAYFSGPVIEGPGRFSDQAKIYYFRGTGGSNQFLHGDYQMAIVMPTDPSKPIEGGIYMQDKNTNSGGQLGFDLKVAPTALDRFGRPTRATFVNDPNVYSGVYFGDIASGSLKIRYFGRQAAVSVNGQVYTSGLTGPFRNIDLITQGGG